MKESSGTFVEALYALRYHVQLVEDDEREAEHLWLFVQSLVESNDEAQLAYLIGFLSIAMGSNKLGEEIAQYRRALAERN